MTGEQLRDKLTAAASRAREGGLDAETLNQIEEAAKLL